MNQSKKLTNTLVNKAWVWLLVTLILIVGAIIIYKLLVKPSSSQPSQTKTCAGFGGYFDSKHKECKNISRNQCENLGGKFITCGSPCRHRPKDAICAQVCEEYCQL